MAWTFITGTGVKQRRGKEREYAPIETERVHLA